MANQTSTRRARVQWLTAIIASLASSTALAQTAIRTDGSLGAAIDLGQGDVTIGESLGQTRGSNLFHSFDRFDIGAGDSATFTGSNTLDNVIARVTGGNASDIDGTLRSTVGNADVWLINPSGIAFGQNAIVDVPGSLFVTTADQLELSDGAVFSAVDPSGSTLSIASPQAFGFLGQGGDIDIDGSTITVGDGNTLELVGGDISISGAAGSSITTPGGTMLFMSTAGPGSVPVVGPIPLGIERGSIDISENAVINTSGDGGGTILIDAGRLNVRGGSYLSADNTGSTDNRGTIALRAGTARLDQAGISTTVTGSGSGVGLYATIDGALELYDSGSLSTGTYATGRAGNVLVQAGSIIIDGSGSPDTLTGIASNTGTVDGVDVGQAGAVDIRTSSLEIRAGGQILSDSFGSGDANSLRITSDEILIGDNLDGQVFTGISSSANAGSSGSAGFVTIDAGSIRLEQGGTIASDTSGTEPAGTVSITANQIVVAGGAIDSSSFAGADSGTISISTDSLSVFSGGQVRNVTYGAGQGGTIAVSANYIAIQEGRIDSSALGDGSGGNVNIEANGILVSRAGQISSNTNSIGDAGSVSITANAVFVDGEGAGNGDTTIASNALANATGNAGQVVIEAQQLDLARGGQISSSAFGAGNGGTVQIIAQNLVTDGVDGTHALTGIFGNANPGSSGSGGTVNINAETISVRRGSQVSSSTFGPGDAGAITVEATDITVDGDNFFEGIVGFFNNASSGSSGSAGQTSITADSLSLFRGGQISSATFGEGNAGSLLFNVGSIVIDRVNTANGQTGIVTNVDQASLGNAGTIDITAQDITVVNGGQIASNSFGVGDAGTVTITAESLFFAKTEAFGTVFTGITSSAEAGSTGDAGRISLDVDRLDVTNGSQLSSSTFGSGDAGGVFIDADQVVVAGFDSALVRSSISSNAALGSTGNGGVVDIRSSNLVIANGGQVLSGTFGEGFAGGVNVETEGLLIAGDPSIGGLTGISSSAEAGSLGNAGSVSISADIIEIQNGGQILSATFSQGDAGVVGIQANELTVFGSNNINIFTGVGSNAETGSTGDAGFVTINAEFIGLRDVGLISSRTLGAGDAGSVNVTSNEITLIDGGQITSTTSTNAQAGRVFVEVGTLAMNGIGDSGTDTTISSDALSGSTGNAGEVTINAGTINMTGGSTIASGTSGSGNAGRVVVQADDLRLENAAKITSLTEASGNAGTVEIDAGRAVFDGLGFVSIRTGAASVATESSTGQAGQAFVRADDLQLFQGGEISSSTFGAGDAGDVFVVADSLLVDGAFFIPPAVTTAISSTADASSSGNAGRVFVNAVDIDIRGLGQITSSTGSVGDAGLVDINAKFLRLPEGGIISSLSAGNGVAGDIRINADQVLATGSAITTSGASTAGGRIDIEAKEAIRISDTQITTSGELPAEGASLLFLGAPFIEILDSSRVLSLTGGPLTPATNLTTGQAQVQGVITVVSDDSEIAATTDVVIQGLDAELGSDLQLPEASPVNVEGLLPASCAVQSADAGSTLTLGANTELGSQPTGPLTVGSDIGQRADNCN